jgi:hypothetical protein
MKNIKKTTKLINVYGKMIDIGMFDDLQRDGYTDEDCECEDFALALMLEPINNRK